MSSHGLEIKSSVDAVEAFWRAANYISVCLAYLRSNPMLLRPLTRSDTKSRSIGHWGCIPSLNFIWANLLLAIRVTGADLRLFIGTGHAGTAWLACTYLEGSLARYYHVGDDEASLAAFSASFGRTGGYTSELSAQCPGVIWPSGELGYTLGIAHGHSLSSDNGNVVVVLGDGELETAATSAALHGVRKFTAESSRLTIIVNLNGLRMGGPSEISKWTNRQIAQYFRAFDLEAHFVDGFNPKILSTLIENSFFSSSSFDRPRLIIFRTPKGATMPLSPKGVDMVGTYRSHKFPVKQIREPDEVAWLEAWLRSYAPEHIFKRGLLDRSKFASILPSKELLIGTVRSRLRSSVNIRTTIKITKTSPKSCTTKIGAFIKSIEKVAQRSSTSLLLTSPDELASNRLAAIQSSNVEIIEYLSEHQCLCWSIGAVGAGRQSWYTSYDGFAPIIGSVVTQYLKFLDSATEASIPIEHASLNIFLTSLGWRNVFSHQDPGFASSLLEKRFSSFRCFMPGSPESTVAAVELSHRTTNLVNCVIVDKYPSTWEPKKAGLAVGHPFTLLERFENAEPSRLQISFLVAGDYLLRETTFAAEAVARVLRNVTTRVIALEELTWLYRSCAEAVSQRESFRHLVFETDVFLLVTSLYEDVVSTLVRKVLPHTKNLLCHGFRSSLRTVTAAGALMECQCSWIQLTAEALNLSLCYFDEAELKPVYLALKELDDVIDKLKHELLTAYDDPEWYWRLQPQDLFVHIVNAYLGPSEVAGCKNMQQRKT